MATWPTPRAVQLEDELRILCICLIYSTLYAALHWLTKFVVYRICSELALTCGASKLVDVPSPLILYAVVSPARCLTDTKRVSRTIPVIVFSAQKSLPHQDNKRLCKLSSFASGSVIAVSVSSNYPPDTLHTLTSRTALVSPLWTPSTRVSFAHIKH